MDGPCYAEYLGDVAVAARSALKIAKNQPFCLLHDGCTWHESNNGPRDAKKKHNINTLQGPQKWPPRSMDLNPIENLFGNCIQLMDKMQRKKLSPNEAETLRRFDEACTMSVNQGWVLKSVQNMQDRCQAVIDNDGGPTRYYFSFYFQPIYFFPQTAGFLGKKLTGLAAY